MHDMSAKSDKAHTIHAEEVLAVFASVAIFHDETNLMGTASDTLGKYFLLTDQNSLPEFDRGALPFIRCSRHANMITGHKKLHCV